jgi:hypothetical protein
MLSTISRKVIVTIGALLLLTMLSIAAYNAVSAQPTVPVGPEASNLGVLEYQVKRDGKNLDVSFTHRDQSKNGTLRIIDLGEDKGVLLELTRTEKVLSITWNPNKPELTLQDSKGGYAHLIFEPEKRQWISDANDPGVLEEHKLDAELMGAIAADFEEKSPSTGLTETPQSTGSCGAETTDGITPKLNCPCYAYEVKGEGVDYAKSVACSKATSAANLGCWNQYCTGCCAWVGDCDCICGIGDFYCSCNRWGWACSGICN